MSVVQVVLVLPGALFAGGLIGLGACAKLLARRDTPPAPLVYPAGLPGTDAAIEAKGSR